MNPYTGADFFSSLLLLLHRLVTGKMMHPAPDELQLIVIGLIGISASFLGTFLVLRKMTMLANALSHTLLLGIVLTFLLFRQLAWMSMPLLLVAALVTALLTTGSTQLLKQIAKLQEDASIGLVFSLFFALGIVLVTLYTKNTHLGVELVLGNADAMQLSDLKLSFMVTCINLPMIAFFYRGFKVSTFDAGFAKNSGFSATRYDYLLMLLVSMTAVSAFRAVGVFMFLAFLTAPVLTARLFCRSLFSTMVGAVAVSLSAIVIGVLLSRHILTVYGLGLSTGGIVVLMLMVQYVMASLLLTLRKRRLYSRVR